MLVSIMGSQGSGKSTCLAEVIKRGHNVIERKTSRSILSDWNVSLDEINSTPTLTIKFQDEILKRKLEDEAEYLDDPDSLWFTERSYVDLFCYSAIMLGHYNEYSDWVNEYYERCAAAQKKYARVCYVQAGVFVPVHDGVRGTNVHYSRLADLFMSDYVTRMTDADKIVRVTAVSVEERVEAILAGL